MTRYVLFGAGTRAEVEASRRLEPGGPEDTAVVLAAIFTFDDDTVSEEYRVAGELASVRVCPAGGG